MDFTTAGLCDRYAEQEDFQIVEPIFKSFGQLSAFSGPITTLKIFEDNTLLRTVLEEPGEGRVLVVDGGGSRRCALLGRSLAELALHNGWCGLIIYGCIRDSEPISGLSLGLRALDTHPLKSHKHGQGERDILITFAGVNFKKDHFLYADQDGIIVSETKLS